MRPNRSPTASHRVTFLAVAVLAAAGWAPANRQASQTAAQPTPSAQTLPGGASQMQETHGNWRVTCAQPGGQKVCLLS